MNTLNLEAAAQNTVTVDTIYGQRRASRRSFQLNRKYHPYFNKGDRVRLIGDGPGRNPETDGLLITVNTLSVGGCTVKVPIDILEPIL